MSNDLRLRVLGKIPEMLSFDGTQGQPKRQISTLVLENYRKSSAKHSIEEAILLNFVKLVYNLCLRLR